MLDFGLEGEGVSLANVSSGGSDFVSVVLCVAAVAALALLVAEAASSEALAVHFEALRFVALANEVLHGRTPLLQKRQLRIKRHRLLPLNGFLARTTRLAFPRGGWRWLPLALSAL